MPQKLGQYFLKNRGAIKKIIAALDPRRGETIIEIGPGRGALTVPLARVCEARSCNIIAIEKDARLAAQLMSYGRGPTVAELKSLRIVPGDALKLINPLTHQLINYKLAGNLPYYITGKLLRLVSELDPKPERCVFMLQQEVAERIAAKPPKMNLLAAAVQIWAEPRILLRLTPEDFDPPPKVESAVVVLKTISNLKSQILNLNDYYRFIRIVFKQPRKTILNNLAAGFPKLTKQEITKILGKNALTGTERPQNLSLEVLITLSRCV